MNLRDETLEKSREINQNTRLIFFFFFLNVSFEKLTAQGQNKY